MEKQAALFELSNVTFSYPQSDPALRSVSLRIGRGERVGVLGANGCGKSTLLKVLCGLLAPQGGEFRAFGSPVDAKSFDNDKFAKSYHRRVGFIFQESDAQLFCSTVREEIAFGPLQLGLSKEEASQRVEEVAKLLGITHLLEKTPFGSAAARKKRWPSPASSS